MKKSIDQTKRAKILSAAVELFRSSHEMRKVSIEDIARQARVSPTTIYNYFGTREALVGEVAKSLVVAIGERSHEFIHSSLPFPQKLVAIISGKIDLTSQMSDEVIAKMVSQDPDMADFVANAFKSEFYPLWHEFLAQGKAEGYVDQDLDAEAFLLLMDILRAGFGSRADLLKDWQKNMAILEKVTRIVFYGFLRKEIDLFPKGDGAENER